MVRNSTIAEFASMMQARILDQPVVDQTGFGAARYDFTLKWTPDASQRAMMGGPEGNTAAAEDPDADLFTAIQQQLGLRLESTRARVNVLVIDHVAKPSAN